MTWVNGDKRRNGHLHKKVILQPTIFKSRLYYCAFLRILMSHSSRHIDVIGVTVSMFSYHSFLDCYIVPKFGIPSFQGILQQHQRQSKGM